MDELSGLSIILILPRGREGEEAETAAGGEECYGCCSQTRKLITAVFCGGGGTAAVTIHALFWFNLSVNFFTYAYIPRAIGS